ncbi:hypothetical protein MTO96_038151, partial [Rhipicephalus appendiculatus]
DDVVNGSNLWFFDGSGCRPWNFPSGKCPSRDGQLFSSVGRCLDACARRRAGSVRPCRTPKPTTCTSKQLKFPFFAADFGRDVSLRCLPTTTAAEAPRRCLAGANRFRTRAACKAACVRRGQEARCAAPILAVASRRVPAVHVARIKKATTGDQIAGMPAFLLK